MLGTAGHHSGYVTPEGGKALHTALGMSMLSSAGPQLEGAVGPAFLSPAELEAGRLPPGPRPPRQGALCSLLWRPPGIQEDPEWVVS